MAIERPFQCKCGVSGGVDWRWGAKMYSASPAAALPQPLPLHKPRRFLYVYTGVSLDAAGGLILVCK